MDEAAVRVGDSERWAVDARLQQAVGDGCLTLAEYEERAGQVWAARTRSELDLVTRDLPTPVPVPRPAARAPVRPRRLLAVMSGDELRARIAPGQGVQAYAVMGGAVVDLRADDLPAEVRVRAVAVMGGIEVLVPHGVTVHLSGLAVMGGRDVTVDPPRPGAPVVHVDAYALMGGVEVTHGRRVPDGGPVQLTKDRPAGRDVAARRGHGHRRRRRFRLLTAVAVVAALVGVPAVAQADDAAVFSSNVVHVRAGESVDVAAVFGSVTVVVPDASPIESGGAMVFGSTDCRSCAFSDPGTTGATVHVHSRGAFGSVKIVRQRDYVPDGSD